MAAAATQTSRVVAGVGGSDLGAPTPCTEWDLRTLLNHTILWTAYSAERRAYGESVDEELLTRDFAGLPGFAADYATQVDRAVAAWSYPEVWERELDVMGAATPAPTSVRCSLSRWSCTAGTSRPRPARSMSARTR